MDKFSIPKGGHYTRGSTVVSIHHTIISQFNTSKLYKLSGEFINLDIVSCASPGHLDHFKNAIAADSYAGRKYLITVDCYTDWPDIVHANGYKHYHNTTDVHPEGIILPDRCPRRDVRTTVHL